MNASRPLYAVLVLQLLVASPAHAAERVERARYVMGTTLSLTLEGEDASALQRAADAAFEEVARLEGLFSNWRSDSEVSRLNARAGGGPVDVSADLASVLGESARWAERTGGAFDPVVEPLVSAYDLRGEGRWPSESELARAVGASGAERLAVEEGARRVSLAPGAGVELGGIGKGYALDRAAEVLRAAGVRVALLDFGGQVSALGAPAGESGWTVGLAHPSDRERASVRLVIRDVSVATSAQSERGLAVEGTSLGHVLDPRTGRPAAAWGAASAVATRATDADAASTALLVLGPEAGSRWIAENREVAALFQEGASPGAAPRVLVAGSHPGLLLAQAEAPPAGGAADTPSNEELARRIDILSEELEDMKQGEAAPPTVSRYGLAPAASRVYTVRRGPSIAGYGEAAYTNYASTNQAGAPSTNRDQADYLRLVTYLGYRFSDKVLFNSELEVEHASTSKGGEVSVEFGYLDFLFDRAINARAGMVLLPVGWVNELHEPPTFLGVSRPETERVVLPSTWRGNGAGVFGEFGTGFSYRAYVVEGLRSVASSSAGVSGFTSSDGIRGGRQNGARSLVENWAGAARLDWAHTTGAALGASLVSGGSAQGDTIPGGQRFTARTTSWDVHAEYRAHGAWLRALYAVTTVDEADKVNLANGYTGTSSVGSRMFGWYANAGYDVLRLLRSGTEMSLYPFVQVEQVDTQDEVPSGYAAAPRNARSIVTGGLSFYANAQVALKADYQWRSNDADTEVNRLQVAVTYLF